MPAAAWRPGWRQTARNFSSGGSGNATSATFTVSNILARMLQTTTR
jgi:hypothetical protein